MGGIDKYFNVGGNAGVETSYGTNSMFTMKDERFTMVVKTDNAGTSASNQFTIPTSLTSFYTIETSDGQKIEDVTGDYTITFTTSGTNTVYISGSIDRLYFNNGGDCLKLLDVPRWGKITRVDHFRSFKGCANMTVSATDTLDVGTSTYEMFYNCDALTGTTLYLDTSDATNFYRMFQSTANFIGNDTMKDWNTSKVTQFNGVFYQASKFNSPLTNWDVSNSINFYLMFQQAAQFNGDVSGWVLPTGNTFSMSSMFYISKFNQDISGWNTAGATNMTSMFRASPFNQDIGSWNVGNVTNMQYMFDVNTQFNFDLNSWDVSKVQTMFRMFWRSRFNNGGVPLSGWTTSACTTMQDMFRDTIITNIDISSFDVSNVTNLSGMFYDARDFDNGGSDGISGWTFNTATTYSMANMFRETDDFNRDIGSWQLSGATTMNSMFLDALAFDQDIGSWDVSNISDMTDFMGTKTPARLSSGNLDAIYNGWSTLDVQTGLTISFGTANHTSGSTAGKAILTGGTNLWTITDGGI